jgi:CheY-like chemotaxis protein
MINTLSVEDDPKSRNVAEMIQRMNPELMNLVLFEDSQNFAQRLQQLEPLPNLILLDIHVTPLNGFEMLEIVRNLPDFHTMPVVAMTASVMNEEVNTLRTAGFDGVFSKPVDMDEFPAAIERIMQGEKLWIVW